MLNVFFHLLAPGILKNNNRKCFYHGVCSLYGSLFNLLFCNFSSNGRMSPDIEQADRAVKVTLPDNQVTVDLHQ